MKLTDRDKRMLFIGSIAVGAYLLFTFVISPVYSYSRLLSDKKEQLMLRLERSVRTLSQKVALNRQLNDLKRVGANLEARLIHARNANVAGAKLQQTLDSFLQRCKLTTRSKKILKTEQRGGFLAVPVELNATGSLSQLKDFLAKVMDDKMLLQVTKLEIRPENQRDPHKIYIDMVIVGYILNETL